MAEGLPLPRPFPWLVEQTTSAPAPVFASSLGTQRSLKLASDVLDSPVSIVEKAAAALVAEFGEALPTTQSVELHLTRGLVDIQISGKAAVGVIGPPEFTYILDVGFDSYVGGVFPWTNIGYGDPAFPNPSALQLRSIPIKDPKHIVFPDIPGSLIIGIVEGTSDDTVRNDLAAAGLKDIDPQGFFATARCASFQERAIAKRLEADVPFVKYAEADHVVRLIDFSPGWQSTRLL